MFTATQILDGMERTLHNVFHSKPLFTGLGCSISYALKIHCFLSIILTILPKFKYPKGFFLTGRYIAELGGSRLMGGGYDS